MKKIYYIFFIFISATYCFKAQVTNPNGYNTFLYDNGTKSSEGTMRDGKADGYWKNYYKNGKIKNSVKFMPNTLPEVFNELNDSLYNFIINNESTTKKNNW